MLNFKLSFSKYNDTEVLIEALRFEKTSAIQFILRKVEQNCSYYLKKTGLSDENLPDILHDGLILLIDLIVYKFFQCDSTEIFKDQII